MSVIELKPKEADIRRQICDLLAHHKDRCVFRINVEDRRRTSSPYLPDGWPDISGFWVTELGTPIPLFIEVKGPGGKVSVEQHEFLSRVSRMNVIAFIARSVEDVATVLRIEAVPR